MCKIICKSMCDKIDIIHGSKNIKPKFIYNCSFLKRFGLDGIVLYPYILIQTSEKDTKPSIIKHEMTHVYQIERDGIVCFYYKILKHIFKTLINGGSIVEAMTTSDYELEAYKKEKYRLSYRDVCLSKWNGAVTNKMYNKLNKLNNNS